ncbi:CHAT domain-containing protein [Streptomyces sp. MBT53]|uniref:CHAT domain-containing protein n=1 Tax=Streptomyces sp. MBT53 TaxID=1488384 RepID=UPI0019128916|nr:CHAT domain-containing protein [Streptomyces sp. MBT53]MBK6012740.1 CHAT domain-containing protein [Streptomyces sp. MBT53]
MASRERRVRELGERVDAFRRDGDIVHVLPLVVAIEAMELWNDVDQDSDLEAMEALAQFFWARYEAQPKKRRIDDLGNAAAAYLRVHRLAPDRVPEPLNLLYKYTDSDTAAQALALPQDPQWPPLVAALGESPDPRARELALEILREASIFDWDPYQPLYLMMLSQIARAMSLRMGPAGPEALDPALLDEAVTAGRAAAALQVENTSLARSIRLVLADTLRARFLAMDDLDALAESVEAYGSVPDLDADASAASADATCTLALRTGAIDQLERGIELWRASVELTPPDSAFHGRRLSGLAGALLRLFEATDRAEVLDEMVSLSRGALQTLPLSDPYRTGVLHNLGSNLGSAGARLGDEELLEEAIRTLEAALAETPDNDPERVATLMSLTGALGAHVRTSDHPVLVARAREVAEELLAKTPPGHPHRARAANNTASLLRDLTGSGTDLTALRKARILHQESFEGARLTATELVERRVNAAATAVDIAMATRGTDDADIAREALAEVGRLETATVDMRMQCAQALARLEAAMGRPAEALRAFEEAAELLPYLIPFRLGRNLRARQLRRVWNFAADAAATAVSAGRPERAVELVELARGVLLGEEMSARGDLARLRERDADLAHRFEALRIALDASDAPGERLRQEAFTDPWQQVHEEVRRNSRHHLELTQNMETLLDDIRGLPGLGDFMLPPPLDRLSAQAAEGPVVIVYAGRERGDALILTGSDDRPVEVVPLPGLSFGIVMEWMGRLDEEETLGELWDVIASRVLAALGPQDRIWWSPVGALTYLPLHAAGRGADSVLDRVVSSYTPTVRALGYARENRGTEGAGGTLLVGMPDTPEAEQLAWVEQELGHIERLVPDARVLTGPEATRDAVLSALPGCAVAHFACHGYADAQAPARSRLLLHDHLTAPLLVGDIGRLRLTGARLAVLSACSTHRTGPIQVDEAVSIAAACQIAGFQQVIGTLWEAGDAIAARFVRAVYEELTDGGTEPLRTERAAYAVHHAVLHLRERYQGLGSPRDWAQFIHVGV